MGSAVQTKTITKLCNPKLCFSDWKSVGGSTIILGSTTQGFGWQHKAVAEQTIPNSTEGLKGLQSVTKPKTYDIATSKEGLFVDGKEYLQY